MAKITTKPVKLKHSRAVKKGRTSRYKGNEKFRQDDEFYNIQTRELSKIVDGGIVQKRISAYRHWTKFLILARELEKQDASIILKKKEFKIKVDESMYVGWDIDKMMSMKFDDWWKTHRHLFISDITRVLSSKDKVSSSKDKVSIEFDSNRRLADVIKDLRRLNNEQNIFGNEDTSFKSNFVINGRVIDATLQNRYNALVLKIEDKLTNKEIVTHEHLYIRPTTMKTRDGYSSQKERKDDVSLESNKDRLKFKKYEVDTKDSAESYVGRIIKPNYAITMFDLITGTNKSWGAVQILLSVCDGYFIKHPTKTYID